jgi:hypothetical protein
VVHHAQRAYHTYFRDHSLQFKFIYYVRWAVFREFSAGEKKRYSYLFFESNFDIPWRSTSTPSPT